MKFCLIFFILHLFERNIAGHIFIRSNGFTFYNLTIAHMLDPPGAFGFFNIIVTVRFYLPTKQFLAYDFSTNACVEFLKLRKTTAAKAAVLALTWLPSFLVSNNSRKLGPYQPGYQGL